MEKYYLNLGTWYVNKARTHINIPLKLRRSLNEKLHVFEEENVALQKNITDSYNKGIKLINNKNVKTVKLFKNNTVQYAKCPDFFINVKGSITKIQLFMGVSDDIGNNGDGLSISIPINISGYLNVPLKSLYQEIDGVPVVCTVIVTLPSNTDEKLNDNEKFIGIIKHELLHIFHSVIKKDFAVNTGRSYYYGYCIAELLNESGIPNDTVLKELLEYPPDDYTYLLIYAAAMYYLDDSEKSAWLQSFDSYDKNYKHPILRQTYNDLMPFRVYSNLYKLLFLYQDELSDIKNVLRPLDETKTKCLEVIQTWADETNNNFNANLIKKWLMRCKQWIINAENIHFKNHS